MRACVGWSGRWELRVSIGRDPLTGKYRYKSKVVDSGDKRDARRQAIAWEAGLSDGRLSGEGGTFGQLCEEWIEHRKRRWSPATLKEHCRIVDRCLGSLRDVDVARIGTHKLDVLYAELTARGGSCQRRPCLAHPALRGPRIWTSYSRRDATTRRPPPSAGPLPEDLPSSPKAEFAYREQGRDRAQPSRHRRRGARVGNRVARSRTRSMALFSAWSPWAAR